MKSSKLAIMRDHKPLALATSPAFAPQAHVETSDDHSRVVARLPSGEAVEVLLHGATVVSWTTAAGRELLWLSDSAMLDGSRPVRGGIPLVFPVFSTSPELPGMPQHGLARTLRWEYLGRSTDAAAADEPAVALDFGLSADASTRALWPHDFHLVYTVTLARAALTTRLVVTNHDDRPFDCHVLMHTYLRLPDLARASVSGLQSLPYLDRPTGATVAADAAAAPDDLLIISGETDRIYSTEAEVVVASSGPDNGHGDDQDIVRITRRNLPDLVVWNPGPTKAAAMADFAPADGWRHMLCVEAGAVTSWQRLEPGDAWEASQTLSLE